LGGDFRVQSNPLLTGVTHSPSPNNFTYYLVNNCNLIVNLDLTPLSGLGGNFQANTNPLLTGITHSPSLNNFTSYYVHSCDLTGNLDLTPLSGLGGVLELYLNPNLTGVTHSPSPNNFTFYNLYNCNLTGNLDLTPLSGLGGQFAVQSNSGLTSISHSPSPNNFTFYYANSCNLTGNLDLTPLSGLGGTFKVDGNTLLTGITHSTSTNNFTQYDSYSCNLTGTLDLSPLTKLGASSSGASFAFIRLYSNPNLTNIILPNSTQFFKNNFNIESLGLFSLYSCNLDYVDFTPLSGATLLSGATQGNPRISLRDNGMSVGDVNHILVDFSGNATYNPTGWSNVNLNIGGSNANPDSSSGGYDGLAAISFLTGSPYNWTITY
jgi:hypothetical protein